MVCSFNFKLPNVAKKNKLGNYIIQLYQVWWAILFIYTFIILNFVSSMSCALHPIIYERLSLGPSLEVKYRATWDFPWTARDVWHEHRILIFFGLFWFDLIFVPFFFQIKSLFHPAAILSVGSNILTLVVTHIQCTGYASQSIMKSF